MTTHFQRHAARYLVGIQAALLLAVFGYDFIENFVLSSGWETLHLRSVDDFAMHDSVRRMQVALLSGQTRQVLTFFDYGYGNIFWLANAIAFLPLYYLDNPQLQIVVGRQVSLLFVFGSIWLIGRIAKRLHPRAASLQWPIALLIATSPMTTIIGTKLHVNAPCIFFGILACHTLIRDERLTTRKAVIAAFWAGIAVGLKLTAVFIAPLLYATLWLRLRQSEPTRVRGGIIRFSLCFGLTATVCTLPALAFFPLFTRELASTYATFQTYKNMGANYGPDLDWLTSFSDTLGYAMHPATMAATLLLFFVLARGEARRGKYLPAALGLGALLAYALVFLTVRKPPLYLATYALSASYFIPLGLLGLTQLRLTSTWQGVIALAIVLCGVGLSADFRERWLEHYRFFEIARSQRVATQLQALDAMRQALGPLPKPVRILQDSTTTFPASNFVKGMEVLFCYGNLRDYTGEKAPRFDYVVLNADDYLFKMLPSSAEYQQASASKRESADQEAASRERLRETGLLGHMKYKLVYEGHHTLVYRLADQ